MIDLRSDTVTLPTDEMREAMRRAELGDDSRDGDPTVRLLEEKSAAMTGKEAAMLVASGTMSNLVCLLAHAQEGGEVLLDPESHILRSEMGGIARLAGLFHRIVPAERGSLDVAALREMLSARLVPARLATALVCVETRRSPKCARPRPSTASRCTSTARACSTRRSRSACPPPRSPVTATASASA
jgi:threonine aldolase